jgi:hypothetical protein
MSHAKIVTQLLSTVGATSMDISGAINEMYRFSMRIVQALVNTHDEAAVVVQQAPREARGGIYSTNACFSGRLETALIVISKLPI